MTDDEHKRVVAALQAVIDETMRTLEHFEATGMDTFNPADYNVLLDILGRALREQRTHQRTAGLPD